MTNNLPPESIQKPSKFGRPKKAESDKRSNPVKLSFTDEELKRLETASKFKGYSQISRYAHDCIIDAITDKELTTQPPVPLVNKEAVNQLAGACNNLNQLTRHFNSQPDEFQKKWISSIHYLNRVAFFCGISMLYIQGRDGAAKDLLEHRDKSNIELEHVEIIINGPGSINISLSNEINSLINSINKNIESGRLSNDAETDHLLMRDIGILKHFLIATACFLLGNNSEGGKYFTHAVRLQTEFQNGNS